VSIRIRDSNIYPIKGNEHMLHLATLTKGLRDFWVMIAVSGPCKGKCYIEEYCVTMIDYSKDVFGHFKFIEDDDLAEELARFAERHKLTDIAARSSEMCETGLGRVVFG